MKPVLHKGDSRKPTLYKGTPRTVAAPRVDDGPFQPGTKRLKPGWKYVKGESEPVRVS